MRVWREYRFSASHRLPHVPAGHKCGRLHGHNYRVRVTVGEYIHAEGPQAGMVVDFAELDGAWAELEPHFDHRHLNDLIPNPTSENLALWIADALRLELDPDLQLVAVEVSESDRSGAEWRGVP